MSPKPIVMILLVLLAGCDGLTSVCTDSQTWGIVVTPVDSLTGMAATGPIAVSALDGQFADSVTYTNQDPEADVDARLATERPGVYDVSVEGSDYLAWRKEDVRVRMDPDDGCHVETVRLTARLQPETS